MRKTLLLYLLLLSCQSPATEKHWLQSADTRSATFGKNPFKTIGDIPVPPGFERTKAPEGSFNAWLRRLPLRSDKTVYLYNGLPKGNQSAQYAVLDMPLTGGELEQCADVVMHLRTDYLLSTGNQSQIGFADNGGKEYLPPVHASEAQIRVYLKTVFARCGTASLERQLLPVNAAGLQAGDVLIKGGSPGHAMLVADMAKDKNGHAIFLLVQGYMPAQDMHIVVNPAAPELSPWYRLDGTVIETPEWTFSGSSFRTWAKR